MSQATQPWKPTPQQIADARGRAIPDVIGPGLRVLLCGINPSLYSAAVGRHFARPGNRFWPALHAGGFTERLFSPFEDRQLLPRGYGLTNLVPRATARADELTEDELREGGTRLLRKVRRHRPRFIAFLGVTAYRTAFGLPKTLLGRQQETIDDAVVWVLPSPSGLNAHHRLADLARLFGDLRQAAEDVQPSGRTDR